MSEERKVLIRALGAQLILTPAEKSIAGSVEEAQRIAASSNQYFMPQQFENQANPQAHFLTTAAEIDRQMEGEKVDILVYGVGSGGTLQGLASYFLKKNPACRICAAEPAGVSVLLGQKPGHHEIQGIGDGFIPQVLDTGCITDIVEVSDEDAIETARSLSKVQGLLVGISSGANIFAALKMAEKYGKDKVIVTVLADRMERYFSTPLAGE